METKVQFNVLEAIENVYKFSKDSQLRPAFFETINADLQSLTRYFQVSELQAVLFANAFILSFDDSTMTAVLKHLGFPDYKLIFYTEDINILFKKQLLIKDRHYNRKRMDFEISKSVSYAVIKNIGLVNEKNEKTNLIKILEEFDKYSDQLDNESIEKYEFVEYINSLAEEYPHIQLFKEMTRWKLDSFEKYFLLDTIWDAVSRGDNDFNTSVQRTVDDFYNDNRGQSMESVNEIIDGKTRLTTLNLIELSKETYRNRTNAKLSKNFLKFLKENESINLEFFEESNKKLIQAKSIKAKELFYSETEIQSIEMLKNTLAETKFRQLQKRLKDKAMPLGITVLLHGKPGTGKTESVYQLAKSSGRNIFKVDISETKSMWFGESQKLVKKIFTDYEEFKESEKKCPILLFNEADAVIGKRKDAGSSNVADTENAIQNILLEELENFDGILFATTNLVENLDSAFERRFLYKINFEKPEPKIASQIWKSKMPFLSDEESLKLASQFSFSGGEMENIARKILMDEVLNNISPNFSQIVKYCQSEKWSEEKGNHKIGF
ncbi:MAG: ATP-binding protein [Bergeyella sp.]